jgi:hypothetical protein
VTTAHHSLPLNTWPLSLFSSRSGLFPRDFEVSVHVNHMLVPVAYGICVSRGFALRLTGCTSRILVLTMAQEVAPRDCRI